MRISVLGGIAAGALAATILLLPVVQLSTPAAAAKKNPWVKQSAVLAACKRTAGCSYDADAGVGCSPNTCFICSKAKKACAAAIKGSKTPSGGNLANLLNPKAGAGLKPVKSSPTKAGSNTVATPKRGVARPATSVAGTKSGTSGTSGRGRPAQNRK